MPKLKTKKENIEFVKSINFESAKKIGKIKKISKPKKDVPGNINKNIFNQPVDFFDKHGNIRIELLTPKKKLIDIIQPDDNVYIKDTRAVDNLPHGSGDDDYNDQLIVNSIKDRHKALRSIKNLTLISIINFFIWPIKKPCRFVYWFFKFRVLIRKQAKYEKKYNSINSETIEDVFAAPQYYQFLKLTIPKDWYRFVLGFIALSVIFIFPIQVAVYYQNLDNTKEEIFSDAKNAFNSLKTAQESIKNLNLSEASKKFQQAEDDFRLAKDQYDKLDIFSKSLITLVPINKKKLNAGMYLLDTGQAISEIGKQLSLSAQAIYGETADQSDWKNSFFSNLAILNDSLRSALPKVAQARELLSDIDISEIMPEKNIINASKALPELETQMADASIIAESLLKAFGYGQWQRYLVLFENNNELRATGGFMGSYALIDVENGEVKNIEIPGGGTYDNQGSLLPMVLSPDPLHLISAAWQFHDSNWWPNFPTSAKKIMWFYENSKGPSVDGVIAVTASFMENILEIAGPIPMENYGRIINQDNFIDETQKIVELEYDKEENRPKQFIADMAPILFKIIEELPREKLFELFSVVYDGFKKKQVMFYSTDETIQNVLSRLEWAGEMNAVKNHDYLSVINTNLAGGKTDLAITQRIKHQSLILDGKIINTVAITKIHNGVKSDIFTGVQNNSYIRIYSPLGSKFIEASGFEKPDESFFEKNPENYVLDEDLKLVESRHLIDPQTNTEIYDENKMTVFANWLSIKPGEEKTVTIKYELPFSLSETDNLYVLSIQKQAGTISTEINSELILDGKYTVAETYPESAKINLSILEDNNIINFNSTLDTDKFYGVKIND